MIQLNSATAVEVDLPEAELQTQTCKLSKKRSTKCYCVKEKGMHCLETTAIDCTPEHSRRRRDLRWTRSTAWRLPRAQCPPHWRQPRPSPTHRQSRTGRTRPPGACAGWPDRSRRSWGPPRARLAPDEHEARLRQWQWYWQWESILEGEHTFLSSAPIMAQRNLTTFIHTQTTPISVSLQEKCSIY